MISWFSHFNFDEAHIVICILIASVVLYECKFEEPITFFWGKPKLFEGTLKQKIYSWLLLVFVLFNILWII